MATHRVGLCVLKGTEGHEKPRKKWKSEVLAVTDADTLAFTANLEDVQKGVSANVSTSDDTSDDTDSDIEELDEDYLVKNYGLLHQQCVAVLEVNRSLSTQLSEVTKERDELKDLSKSLKNDIVDLQQAMKLKMGELEHHQKLVKMMNNGTEKLDRVLEIGQCSKNKAGLGYENHQWKPTDAYNQSTFVPAKEKEKSKLDEVKTHGQNYKFVKHSDSKKLTQTHTQDSQTVSTRQARHPSHHGNNSFVPICHYCDRRGHIRPRCRFYLDDRRKMVDKRTYQPNKVYERSKEGVGYSKGKIDQPHSNGTSARTWRPICRSYHKDKRVKNRRKIQKKWLQKPIHVHENVKTDGDITLEHDSENAKGASNLLEESAHVSANVHSVEATEFAHFVVRVAVTEVAPVVVHKSLDPAMKALLRSMLFKMFFHKNTYISC